MKSFDSERMKRGVAPGAGARRRWLTIGLAVMFVISVRAGEKPSVPVGIFLGRIEEGARIFTPVRLLPFEHPEAAGHQFPNALQLFGTECEALVWLGRQAGLEIGATLMRYPTEPSPAWPYPQFSQPPDSATMRALPCIRRPAAEAPLRGLRAVLVVGGHPSCFIVDTRNLSLAERRMKRPSSMGLDIDRAAFLAAMEKSAAFLRGQDSATVVFDP